MAIYRIYEEDMPGVEKKIKRIVNKCKAYGTPYTYEVVAEEYEAVGGSGDAVEYAKVFVIEVRGVAQIKDWSLVACLYVTEKGNVIKNFNNMEVPSDFYIQDKYCGHCKVRRRRKSTFIIQNLKTAEIMQVGSSCLNDFTEGVSVEYATLCMKYLDIFDEASKRKTLEVTKSGVFRTKDVLLWGLEYIKTHEYVNTERYLYREKLSVLVDKGYVTGVPKYLLYNYSKGVDDVSNVIRFGLQALQGSDKELTNTVYSEKNKQLIDTVLKYFRRLSNESEGNLVHSLHVLSSRPMIEKEHIAQLLTVFPMYFYLKNQTKVDNAYQKYLEQSKIELQAQREVELKAEEEANEVAERRRVKALEESELQAQKDKEWLTRSVESCAVGELGGTVRFRVSRVKQTGYKQQVETNGELLNVVEVLDTDNNLYLIVDPPCFKRFVNFSEVNGIDLEVKVQEHRTAISDSNARGGYIVNVVNIVRGIDMNKGLLQSNSVYLKLLAKNSDYIGKIRGVSEIEVVAATEVHEFVKKEYSGVGLSKYNNSESSKPVYAVNLVDIMGNFLSVVVDDRASLMWLDELNKPGAVVKIRAKVTVHKTNEFYKLKENKLKDIEVVDKYITKTTKGLEIA